MRRDILRWGTRKERVDLLIEGMREGFVHLQHENGFPFFIRDNGTRVYVLSKDLNYMLRVGLIAELPGVRH